MANREGDAESSAVFVAIIEATDNLLPDVLSLIFPLCCFGSWQSECFVGDSFKFRVY